MARNHLNKVKISDHALIRYIERIKGVDLEPIRNEILSSGICEVAEELGYSGIFPCDKFKAVMREATITTIMPLEFKMNKHIMKTKNHGKHSRKGKKR